MNRPLSRRHLIAGGAGAAGAIGLGAGAALGSSTVAATSGPTAGQLVVLPEPYRLFDSRDPDNFLGGRKLVDGDTVDVIAGYPGSDMLASVFVNVTVTQTESAGYLAVRAADPRDGVEQPTTSNINWTTNDVTLANLALSQVGAENSIALWVVGADAATHVIVDLQGYMPLEFPDE